MSPNRRLFINGVPPPYDGFLSLRAQSKEPKERAPRTLRPHTRRVPSLGGQLRRFAQGTSLCLGRTRGSVPRHFVLALRSLSSLGLSKGVPKQNKYTRRRRVGVGLCERRTKNKKHFSVPAGRGGLGRGIIAPSHGSRHTGR